MQRPKQTPHPLLRPRTPHRIYSADDTSSRVEVLSTGSIEDEFLYDMQNDYVPLQIDDPVYINVISFVCLGSNDVILSRQHRRCLWCFKNYLL